MKKIQIFLVALAMHASNMYGTVTAESPLFLLTLAVKSSQQLENVVLEENDGVMATTLIAVMQDCINFSKKTKSQISSNSSFLALKRSTIVDLEKSKQEQEDRYERFKDNIKKYEKHGVTAVEKKTVDNRRDDRDKAKKAAAQAANSIVENKAQIDTTTGKNAVLEEQLVQNEKMFEEALDAYITNLGKVVLVDGIMQITYKRYPGQPITPEQYSQLVKVLEDARVEFEKQEKNGWSKNVMIDLEVDEQTELFSLSEVIDCIGRNKPVAGTNYSVTALKVVGGLTIAALVATAAYAGYNKYEGKDAFDRGNLDALGNYSYQAGANALTSIKDGATKAGQAIYDTSAGKYVVDSANAGMLYGKETVKAITESEAVKQIYELQAKASNAIADSSAYKMGSSAYTTAGEYASSAYDTLGSYGSSMYDSVAGALSAAGSYLPSWSTATEAISTASQNS